MHITRSLCTLFFLGSAAIALAQAPQPLTYVAIFRVEPENVQAFVAKSREYVPTLDKLMAEGALTAYGIDVDVLHHPTRSNVAFWYTAANMGSLQKATAAIDAFQARLPELLKATAALTNLSKHQDIIVRSVEGNWSRAGACSNPLSTFNISVVRPGKTREFLDAFRTHRKPVLEQLVKDGVICSYQVDVEEFHTIQPGMTWVIVVTPDMAALDKVNAAFEAADSKLSANERAARSRLYLELVDAAKHEDSLSRSAVYKVK